MNGIEATNLRAAEDVAEFATRNGYARARVLPDGSVAAVSDLAFTRALYLGVTETGWARRFCFANFKLADRRFLELQSEDDIPAGHVATRGR